MYDSCERSSDACSCGGAPRLGEEAGGCGGCGGSGILWRQSGRSAGSENAREASQDRGGVEVLAQADPDLLELEWMGHLAVRGQQFAGEKRMTLIFFERQRERGSSEEGHCSSLPRPCNVCPSWRMWMDGWMDGW